MKVAILSDIHGNQHALQAVLEEAESEDVDHVIVLGDFLGYYYRPDKVLQMLASWECTFIQGNHEDMYLAGMKDEDTLLMYKKKYGSGLEKAYEHLSEEQHNFIVGMERSSSIVLDGKSFDLNHEAPLPGKDYLYPDAPMEELNQCDSDLFDYVLFGHTHYALLHENQHSILLNPGSVGQNRKQGGMASWALIDTSFDSCELKLTSYDVTLLLEEIQQFDPDREYLRATLKRK